MADYNLNANITANTKGYEAGIKKAQEITKKFSTSVSKVIQGLGKNGLVGALGAVGLVSSGLSATLGSVVKIARKVSATINECTEAYRQQLIAERQLETAINNNPLVTGSAKKRLTEFASEMQKVSNYGDDELIPMMANLVSLGRTEEETMKIMSVAMDMSASGSMSLDTAINQLNATLNGNIGRLGQQNAELKGLTEEELKSGKAVEILGEKFKGLAQSTVDTSKQLKNIKGDFKEAIGEFTLPSSDMWNKFWIGFYDKGISVIKQFDEYMDKTIIGKGISNALSEQLKKITDERQRRLYSEDEIHLLSDTQLKALENYLSSLKKLNKEQQVLLQVAKDEAQSRIFLAKLYEDMDKEEAERQKAIQEQKEAENEIVKLKEEYLKKVAEQERKWQNIKDVTGEEVKNEEKIKFYQDSLVDLMTQAGGQITTNNQLYKDQLAIIQKLQDTLEPEEKKTSNKWAEKLVEQAIERLETEKKAMMEARYFSEMTEKEKYLAVKYYNDRILQMKLQLLEAEKQKELESVKDFANAEQEKQRIIEYYNNQMADVSMQYVTQMGQEGEASAEAFGEGFSEVIAVVSVTMKTIVNIVKATVSLISKAIQKVKPIITKLLDMSTDDMLDSLLKLEDKILTFFVETLPKLPQFLASALQSVGVLIKNVFASGGLINLADIIVSMAQSLLSEVPKIITALIPVVERIVTGLFNAIKSLDLEEIFSGFLDMAMNGLEWLTDSLVSSIPKILKMFTTFVKKIGAKLPTLVRVLIPAIAKLITEVVKALPSLLNEILPSLLQTVLDLVKELLKNLPQIIQVVVKVLPELISGVVSALSDFISNLTADDLFAIVGGIINAVATLGASLVKAIPQILKGLWELAKGLVKGMWNLIVEALKATWKGLKWVLDLVVEGFKNTFGGYATGTNNAQKGYALVGEQGPEIVKFNGGEKVYNATNTQRMLAGATGGSSNSFNVTFNNTVDTTAYALMQQLRAYNRQMAINGII